ncbi:MAG: biotin-dependent carboxyltransferase family protein [Algibacter sp.]|uniref:5-oxoprolinase subunit C family protein n=1 Tax=Algibacter sp. TaxID=1872428 RepID=UPI002607ECF1|nr:biotin-dependent carboxyltransferase family protein [Algibacter sp.]MDG1728362.1 biotin-dependent carboxyltransferase family protein [Algibacter sp.]MDG2178295.1 biotin-dependent carboxyltransferase family protein [Algibacter sp.]
MVDVLQAGFYSSIQDLGRYGFQDYGVPYSGVMDEQAATIANLLLGNNTKDAVLEMTIIGAKLKFECDTLICLSGAYMNPQLNKKPIKNNKVFKVHSGDVLSFGKLESGCRCYLSVLGGFKTEKVMESRSMYQHITAQSTIRKGDKLAIEPSSLKHERHYSNLRINSSYLLNSTLNVLKGPEFEKLSIKQQEQVLNTNFTISKLNNRMAYQLESPIENSLESIITSPVLPGTVQLTPSGKLIVLMRDCQTTGGYPRVMQLTKSALNVLGQKFVGQTVKFNLISKF